MMAIAIGTPSLDCEISMKTVQLEKEYEKAIVDSARLLDAEKDRMRRMEQLLLQFEGEALRSKLDQTNEQLLGLTQIESEVRLQLDEAYHEIDRLDQQVQVSSIEIQRLEGELATLRNASTGYNSLAAERIHLSRENSELRSEIEQLRSRDSSHQVGIVERHEMERHLNSLEVHLENERHAHERTRTKSAQQAAEITKLSSKIEEMQGELTRESRARQQHEREIRQQNTGWDAQRAVLEGKIETLRKQLRSTKDRLQEAQQDSQHKRNHVSNHEGEVTESRPRVVPLQRPGPSADYQSGVTIATPGAVRVREKANRQPALPGEKSAFSITPFLNRTSSTKDSPLSSEPGEDEMDVTMDGALESFNRVRAVEEPGELDAVPKSVPGPTQNVPAKGGKSKPKAREAKPAAKRAVDEYRKPASRLNDQVSSQPSEERSGPSVEQAQAKPKRRKLGAQRDRNLFDDDEEEEEMAESRKPGRKIGLGVGRNSVLAGALPGASASERLPRALGLGAPMGFSPLKRDRKRL